MKYASIRNISVLAAALVLSACKLDATAPLYVGDLLEVIETQKAVKASIDLHVPITSVDKCDEQTTKIRGILVGFFNSFEMQGCEKKGSESFAKVKVDSEITNASSELGLFFVANKQSSDIAITLSQKSGFMSSLMAAIKKETMATIDLNFTIRLNNDTRDIVTLKAQNVFVNQKPVAKLQTFQLERRDEYVIKMSDVSVAAFQAGENVEAFSMTAK